MPATHHRFDGPIGLVNELAPKGCSLGRAIELAKFLCSLPQPAMRLDEEAAMRGYGLPLNEGLQIEAECFNRSIHQPKIQEGLRRFLERGHPGRHSDEPSRTPGLVRG